MTIDPKKINILLVEDAATMRKIEVKTLNTLGFKNITEAENGAIAIKKLQEDLKVDLIISDWNMPEKDGLELLKWVRSQEKHKHIPFLMATGQGDKLQERKAVDAGVSSFVAKPFDSEELKNKIDEAFGIREVEHEMTPAERKPRRSASGKVKLKVAHIQITDHLILGVLKHLIDRNVLAPKYFDLEVQCMAGWNPVRESLERGTVDAACILAPIAMDLFSDGVPIKLVLQAHKNGSIFVRGKHGQYREPFQDFFRRKTFLIPHKMSIHHMLAHMFFKNIGLKSGLEVDRSVDVNLEVIAPIKMPEFLKTNPDSCGFMVAEPLGTKAIAMGAAELQFLSGELWENHPCCVVAMRDDYIGPYNDAVYEFVSMLVQAGRYIENKPEMSAEIAVDFLDPYKKLKLTVPILKNVLTEAQGIKSADLYPAIEDLETIQRYMYYNMGIGALIDLEKFVDTRFADSACQDSVTEGRKSRLHETSAVAFEILKRGGVEEEKTTKSMLSKEGKYLTFNLGDQEYGINILKVKEIIGMMPIRTLPQTSNYVKGVINLRDTVIPVIDLRLKFGMEEIEYTDRTCIIVLQFETRTTAVRIGVAVDSVSEVLGIRASEIEETPSFGASIDTRHILAIAKKDGDVKILLDIDEVVDCREVQEEVEEFDGVI